MLPMPPPSCAALKLSEEAQDLICSYVADFEDQDAVPTLRALCLTSRAFLESAQHALYKEPGRALRRSPSWSRATALLNTLSTSPGLALHVRSLYTLDRVTASLAITYPSDDISDMDFLETLALGLSVGDPNQVVCQWAYDVALLCAGVTSIACPFESVAMAKEWKLIAKTHDRLDSVRVSAEKPSDVDLKAFEAWASGWRGKQLKKVSVVGLKWSTEVTREAAVQRFPFYTQILRLERLYLTPLQIMRCIPSKVLPLKTVIISTYGQGGSFGTGASFEVLFKTVGKEVRTFTFNALHSYPVQDVLEAYSASHQGPILTPASFEAFPCAISLTLRHVRDMSVGRLAALARTSPRLQTLDLQWSSWDIDLDLEMDSLLAALKSFPRLRNLDLGYLPVVEDDAWELDPIEAWASAKGLHLSWQGCEYDDEHGSLCDCYECYEEMLEMDGYDSGCCEDPECECGAFWME